MGLFKGLILILLGMVITATAQQDAHFSQFMYSYLANNPGYFNPSNIEFTLIHRSQWLGYQPSNYPGTAPTTQYLGIVAPAEPLHGSVGLSVAHDQLGGIRNTYGKLNYAYHVKMKESTLSFGLGGGIYSFSTDAKYIYNDQNDPNINTGSFQQIKPDVSGGIWYTHPKYYVGFGINHLSNPKFADKGAIYSSLGMHYYLSAGYNFTLNDQLKLKPAFIVKSDKKPQNLSLDLNTTLEINNKYWVGGSYRYQEAFVALVGISLLKSNALKFGYAFDFVNNGRGAKATTSHELMLSYVIPTSLSINKPIIRTPRYRYN